jgi:hypothetical protein
MSSRRAFLAAAAYASFNPKTLAFVVLASLTVTGPVAFAVIAPHRSADSLTAARLWLGDNGSMVTAAVLGVVLLYSAITGLLQLA